MFETRLNSSRSIPQWFPLFVILWPLSINLYIFLYLLPGNAEDGAASVTTTGAADTVEPTRIIFINRPQPDKFCSNKVSTAKYNVLSFIPIFLFEQFRRYSNIFFLFIALLQVSFFFRVLTMKQAVNCKRGGLSVKMIGVCFPLTISFEFSLSKNISD